MISPAKRRSRRSGTYELESSFKVFGADDVAPALEGCSLPDAAPALDNCSLPDATPALEGCEQELTSITGESHFFYNRRKLVSICFTACCGELLPITGMYEHNLHE